MRPGWRRQQRHQSLQGTLSCDKCKAAPVNVYELTGQLAAVLTAHTTIWFHHTETYAVTAQSALKTHLGLR